MKELKIIAGFALSLLAFLAVFALGNAIYRLEASVSAVTIVMGLSAVLRQARQK